MEQQPIDNAYIITLIALFNQNNAHYLSLYVAALLVIVASDVVPGLNLRGLFAVHEWGDRSARGVGADHTGRTGHAANPATTYELIDASANTCTLQFVGL